LLPVASFTTGVGQPAKFACLGNWSNRSEPSSLGLMSAPLSFQSLVVVVTQPAISACAGSAGLPQPFVLPSATSRALRATFVSHFSLDVSLTLGVCQPLSNKPEALADMRGADARSAQIRHPNGVSRYFQVSAYSVEPAEAVLARNLLSKDNWRMALGDEAIELGPEVPVVIEAFSLPGGAEGLAGAGAGPDGSVVGPSGETEGVGPDADAGEEVALGVAAEVRSSHVPNGSFIYVTFRYQSTVDQVAQPLRGVGVYLIIVRNHSSTSSFV
jgi:hypothetical protein